LDDLEPFARHAAPIDDEQHVDAWDCLRRKLRCGDTQLTILPVILILVVLSRNASVT